VTVPGAGAACGGGGNGVESKAGRGKLVADSITGACMALGCELWPAIAPLLLKLRTSAVSSVASSIDGTAGRDEGGGGGGGGS